MSKVTSKLQLTIPKAIAEQYAIEPGHELAWEPAGETIRLVPARSREAGSWDVELRLALFDAATERQRRRQAEAPAEEPGGPRDRGWRREDLYDDRGLSR